MKKYTDREFERLKRKYLTDEELRMVNGVPIVFLIFTADWMHIAINFALLIRAAEGEL